jgi:hypothetical protein
MGLVLLPRSKPPVTHGTRIFGHFDRSVRIRIRIRIRILIGVTTTRAIGNRNAGGGGRRTLSAEHLRGLAALTIVRVAGRLRPRQFTLPTRFGLWLGLHTGPLCFWSFRIVLFRFARLRLYFDRHVACGSTSISNSSSSRCRCLGFGGHDELPL